MVKTYPTLPIGPIKYNGESSVWIKSMDDHGGNYDDFDSDSSELLEHPTSSEREFEVAFETEPSIFYLSSESRSEDDACSNSGDDDFNLETCCQTVTILIWKFVPMNNLQLLL